MNHFGLLWDFVVIFFLKIVDWESNFLFFVNFDNNFSFFYENNLVLVRLLQGFYQLNNQLLFSPFFLSFFKNQVSVQIQFTHKIMCNICRGGGAPVYADLAILISHP